MRNNGSLIGDAPGSPQSLRPVGVRRLNHLPLYIAGFILLLVAGLIVWVAMTKVHEQAPKAEDHGGSADAYAQQVAGDKRGYMPAENSTPTPTPTPNALTDATPTPLPNTEMDARHKAFYEAL